MKEMVMKCPFCNGDDIRVESTDPDIWFCTCCACKADGPIAENQTNAITKWNRRAK